MRMPNGKIYQYFGTLEGATQRAKSKGYRPVGWSYYTAPPPPPPPPKPKPPAPKPAPRPPAPAPKPPAPKPAPVYRAPAPAPRPAPRPAPAPALAPKKMYDLKRPDGTKSQYHITEQKLKEYLGQGYSMWTEPVKPPEPPKLPEPPVEPTIPKQMYQVRMPDGTRNQYYVTPDKLQEIVSQEGYSMWGEQPEPPEIPEEPEEPEDVEDTGLTPELQELLSILELQLEELESQGKVLNPAVEITDQQLTDFMAQAETEIAPYYASQLKLARHGFMESLGYAQEEIEAQEVSAQRQYGRELRGLGEEMAERGFATSGRRMTEEQELATQTQEALDVRRRTALHGAESMAGQFAEQWGETGMPSAPTMSAAPQVVAGQRQWQTGAQTPFYELSDDVYAGLKGTREFEEQAQIRTRTSELEKAFRQKKEAELRSLQL